MPRLESRIAAGLLLLGLSAACACGVPRPGAPRVDPSDYATLPNLKRAEEALQDRITREQEHVEALNQRLAMLRNDEERLHAQTMEAEADYQLRQGDLDGVRADLARAQAELTQVQGDLEAARLELGRVQAETRAILEETAQLRLLVARGQVALESLPPEVRAFLAEAPQPAGGAAGAATDPAAPAGTAPAAEPAAPPAPEPAPAGSATGAAGSSEPAKP